MTPTQDRHHPGAAAEIRLTMHRREGPFDAAIYRAARRHDLLRIHAAEEFRFSLAVHPFPADREPVYPAAIARPRRRACGERDETAGRGFGSASRKTRPGTDREIVDDGLGAYKRAVPRRPALFVFRHLRARRGRLDPGRADRHLLCRLAVYQSAVVACPEAAPRRHRHRPGLRGRAARTRIRLSFGLSRHVLVSGDELLPAARVSRVPASTTRRGTDESFSANG